MTECIALLDRPVDLRKRLPIGAAAIAPAVAIAEQQPPPASPDVAIAIGSATINAERLSLPRARNAAADPEVAAVQQDARQEARTVMEAHLESLCAGEDDKVPLEADAGGTARKLVAIGEVFGKDSPEYQQAWEALLRDCERRVAEAYRVNGWELFDITPYDFDPETGDFYVDGYNVSEIMRNGLTPATNPACPEEPERRINEYVEVVTDAVLMTKGDMNGRGTVVFSQCPQSLIDRYRRNPKNRVYSDYVPAIAKMMVRYKIFDPVNNRVYLQQMSVSGTHINNEVINKAMAGMGVVDGQRLLDRTEVHGTQTIVDSQDVPDVVAMVRLLDKVASEHHGMPIFLGSPLRPGQEANYDKVYEAAASRRREQRDLTERYARHLLGLAEAGADRRLQNHEADKFMRAELLRVAQADPDKAEMMFNRETADGFRLANVLEAQGQIQAASQLRQEVAKSAPEAGGCGAGACGLVKLSSAEEKAVQDLLGVKSDEQAIRDDERPCKKCGQKTVVYVGKKDGWKDYRKGCLSCKVVEGPDKKANQPDFTIRRPQTKQLVKISQAKKRATPPAKRSQLALTA